MLFARKKTAGVLKKQLFLAPALAAFLLAGAAGAVEIRDIPGFPGSGRALGELYRTMYPPWTYDVKIGADEDGWGAVEAVVYNDRDLTDDETYEVYIVYSTDSGESWETVELDQGAGGQKWFGRLPEELEEKEEILYYIKALDTSTNVYTELACPIGDAEDAEDGCWFDVAVDEPPVDDETAVIPDEFDIRSFRAGYSEDYLYLSFLVEGEIKEGTASPLDLHGHVAAIINPDRGDPVEILTQGFLAAYAPLAEMFTYPGCMLVYYPGSPDEDYYIDRESIRCYTDGSYLTLEIDRGAFGENPSGYLKVAGGNGRLASISPVSGNFYDLTHVSTLTFTSRTLRP
ncbi:MAG: hypothetical protein AB1742_05290 [bacterium]